MIVTRPRYPALTGFHEPVRAWFSASFETPTPAQELGWPAIQAGESTLILAPTGSGKTLAAFLAAIDRLMFDPVPARAARCRVLYISPLKALGVDIERNLRAPLAGIARQAEAMARQIHEPAIAVRTGDTPSRERARFTRDPADILITTPESLYLLLTSRAREALRAVQLVIVDEVHALVATKRGAHLAVSLERLQALTDGPLQRIGLSATQQPLDEAARFIGGFAGARAEPRSVRIVDAGRSKTLELRVEVPVEDMAASPHGPPEGESSASIWPAIHPRLLELIRAHRSTLIFVNSRRLAERLAAALNELAGEVLVHAHHGSVAREQRMLIENELKDGRLPAIVATSSLELGIDMGAIDLVIQVEAPPSVASGIQRIGRAGHRLDVPSAGVIVPKYRGDLLACAGLTERMQAGAVEPLRYLRNPLDVLAQQIVAMVAVDDWTVDALEGVIRRAAPFAELARGTFHGVLDMLSGRYPSDDFAELRPRVTWDRLTGRLTAREGARRIAVVNGGTIPDRGLYGVFLLDAEKGRGRVGELDEEMVFESRVGETFVLGASTWRIEEITHDRVLVSPAPGVPGKMPFWHGDASGRSLEFGRAIGALTRRLRELPEAEAIDLLTRTHALEPRAARTLLRYVQDQVEAAGAVPDDRTIVVERYLDEMGDWRVCVLSPFGGKVHAPWAMAIGAIVRERDDRDIDVLWSDDGIVARFPEADQPPDVAVMFPDPDEVEELVVRQLGAVSSGARQSATALFASRFREAAARALLLPRRSPQQRAPLWQQRRRAAELLQATARYRTFPIVLETYRECLRDVFDMPALVALLREIQEGVVRVVPVTTRRPSPFAAALMFNYVANFIYEGDAPLAERRAQALTVDPAQLRELLGEAELRELLDADALRTLERYLQHLTPERAARHADALHDLFIGLGDLSRDEVLARATAPTEASGWLARLERERRVITLVVAGEGRWIAAEDAGRYRDGLGIPPPPGLPEAFLESVGDPLGDLVSRYARSHGPFHAVDVAERFGVGAGPVEAALETLEAAGRVVRGEFRPGGTGREWCDTGVLRALRQKSLARLRREVEPVDQAALGRLYVAWQGIGADRRGRDALLDAIEQLQGAAIPASVLETQVLPARLGAYDARDLDTLTASGAVVWMGAGSLGQHDGKVALYLTERIPLLVGRSSEPGPREPIHDRIREYLRARGASFFAQLVQALGGFAPDTLRALWELVWAGQVTNDTLAPLRAYLNPHETRRGREARKQAKAVVRRWRAAGGAVPPARSLPAEASGRWVLVESLRAAEPTPTERLSALAHQLLQRHGVLTREAVQAEGLEGGFSTVYGVLKAMEEAGRVRRGYFVSGRGATQFALPGVVDQLRALREPGEEMRSVVLAATDPANPYGAALPWPEREESRKPMRMAGALVVLIDGALAAWMARGERQLLTFVEALADRDPTVVRREIARALATEVGPRKRAFLFIQEIDAGPPGDSALAPALRDAGFLVTPNGYLKRV